MCVVCFQKNKNGAWEARESRGIPAHLPSYTHNPGIPVVIGGQEATDPSDKQSRTDYHTHSKRVSLQEILTPEDKQKINNPSVVGSSAKAGVGKVRTTSANSKPRDRAIEPMGASVPLQVSTDIKPHISEHGDVDYRRAFSIPTPGTDHPTPPPGDRNRSVDKHSTDLPPQVRPCVGDLGPLLSEDSGLLTPKPTPKAHVTSPQKSQSEISSFLKQMRHDSEKASPTKSDAGGGSDKSKSGDKFHATFKEIISPKQSGKVEKPIEIDTYEKADMPPDTVAQTCPMGSPSKVLQSPAKILIQIPAKVNEIAPPQSTQIQHVKSATTVLIPPEAVRTTDLVKGQLSPSKSFAKSTTVTSIRQQKNVSPGKSCTGGQMPSNKLKSRQFMPHKPSVGLDKAAPSAKKAAPIQGMTSPKSVKPASDFTGASVGSKVNADKQKTGAKTMSKQQMMSQRGKPRLPGSKSPLKSPVKQGQSGGARKLTTTPKRPTQGQSKSPLKQIVSPQKQMASKMRSPGQPTPPGTRKPTNLPSSPDKRLVSPSKEMSKSPGGRQHIGQVLTERDRTPNWKDRTGHGARPEPSRSGGRSKSRTKSQTRSRSRSGSRGRDRSRNRDRDSRSRGRKRSRSGSWDRRQTSKRRLESRKNILNNSSARKRFIEMKYEKLHKYDKKFKTSREFGEAAKASDFFHRRGSFGFYRPRGSWGFRARGRGRGYFPRHHTDIPLVDQEGDIGEPDDMDDTPSVDKDGDGTIAPQQALGKDKPNTGSKHLHLSSSGPERAVKTLQRGRGRPFTSRGIFRRRPWSGPFSYPRGSADKGHTKGATHHEKEFDDKEKGLHVPRKRPSRFDVVSVPSSTDASSPPKKVSKPNSSTPSSHGNLEKPDAKKDDVKAVITGPTKKAGYTGDKVPAKQASDSSKLAKTVGGKSTTSGEIPADTAKEAQTVAIKKDAAVAGSSSSRREDRPRTGPDSDRRDDSSARGGSRDRRSYSPSSRRSYSPPHRWGNDDRTSPGRSRGRGWSQGRGWNDQDRDERPRNWHRDNQWQGERQGWSRGRGWDSRQSAQGWEPNRGGWEDRRERDGDRSNRWENRQHYEDDDRGRGDRGGGREREGSYDEGNRWDTPPGPSSDVDLRNGSDWDGTSMEGGWEEGSSDPPGQFDDAEAGPLGMGEAQFDNMLMDVSIHLLTSSAHTCHDSSYILNAKSYCFIIST